MKILCDVCDKDEASLFCIADEAALCAACDRRVHHANKLAGKHLRYSLHHPSPKQSPLCDICQEKRALLFCREDRAILCRDCDISIHKTNEHTQKHTRFLLTGLKLSASSHLCSQSSPESPSSILSKDKSTPSPVSPAKCPVLAPLSFDKYNGTNLVSVDGSIGGNSNSYSSSSSISEYLIETLPGWHVEELLESSFPSPFGFCKSGCDDVLPDLGSNTREQSFHSAELVFGAPNFVEEQSKEFGINNMMNYGSKVWQDQDSCFVVPQIKQSFNSSKRLRTLW